MPEGPPDPAGQHDGAERTVVEGSHGRVSLDVSEWVSELRRLYVEPKTRAARRQEGAIAPQKRRLGRARGRGSARAADLTAAETEGTGDVPAPAEGSPDAVHPNAGSTSRPSTQLAGRPDRQPGSADDNGNDVDAEPEADETQRETSKGAEAPQEAPWTRASARAASGHESERRRRSLIVGLVVVALVIVAWYLLLRR